LTWSAPPRAPSVSPSASTMSDLPLPVSPVRRLRPRPKRTRDSATNARSRTLSSFSKGPSFQRDQRPAPAQLVGQALVEALGRAEPHHLQTPRQRTAAQYVRGLPPATTPAAVDAQVGGPARH